METWTQQQTIYTGKIFRVSAGKVALEDGTLAQREIVEHPGGVGIIPFTGTSVIFVRQYRIAIGKTILEMPAGKREGDEPPADCGMRELIEETGLRAGRLIPAGAVYASVGYCSELIHIFLALDLEHVGQNLDHEERIELVEMPIDDVRTALREHRFDDAKTVVGLHALFQYLDAAKA